MMSPTARKWIGLWLIAGCVMVFAQVAIGGITRLTESGLSITEWKVVSGVVPPVTESAWIEEFGKYQQTPQFNQVNQDITLSEFKFIFFWEYFHRLNARIMGLVFVVGFLFFIYKKWIDRNLALRFSMLLVMGTFIGILGWIMVKSGLSAKPYVSPISLTFHLSSAFAILSYLVWLVIYVFRGRQVVVYAPRQKRLALAVMILLFVQLFLGGILSGMKAGLAYPTWPDMNGQWIPSALTSMPVRWDGILYYDAGAHWEQTFIQFVHRCTAYLLVGAIIWFFFQLRGLSQDRVFNYGVRLFPVTVLLQATIGIITVLHCVGHVPVFWGVLHQAGAMLLLANTTFIYYHLTVSRAQ